MVLARFARTLAVTVLASVAGMGSNAVAVSDNDGWAVVEADGTLVRGYNVRSARAVSRGGRYEVVFRFRLVGCAYLATVGGTGDVSPTPGWATTARRNGQMKVVEVATFRADGQSQQLPFHVLVACKPAR